MNTNQIQCFLKAARSQSFSAAAAELFLSPQAVSKQVIALEKELDVRLFERNGPRLSLTPTGVLYRRLLEEQTRQHEFLLDDVKLHRRSLALSLRLGVSEWLDPASGFHGGLQSFFAQKPDTVFSLRHFDNSTLFKAIADGELDGGFFSGGQMPERREMEMRSIATEEMLLYAPVQVGTGAVPTDCWGMPWLTAKAWNWPRSEYRLLSARERLVANLDPPALVTMPNYPSLLAEMRMGGYVTLSGSRFGPFTRDGRLYGHSIGLTDEVVFVWLRTNENPLLPELAEYLGGFFQET